MRKNYKKWFYAYHTYLASHRNGKSDYTDTKWVNMVNRYKNLVDIGSPLLNQQPFGVFGNNYGFDNLIDLMGRSNYTFEDINDSLIETYRMSLRNAMSRNLENTHAIMFHTNNMDSKHVRSEQFTHYKIIDAPMNQLHFGHRDEFIRQKIQQMHSTEFDNYVNINDFNSSPLSDILNFSIICTVNGYICNDCMVAVSDKGFKFKVGWGYSSDVDFIVYKLDHCVNLKYTTDSIENNMVIPYSAFPSMINSSLNGVKCILDIYDVNFIKTSPAVPNFGIFTDKGLKVVNLQQETLKTFERQKTSKINIEIFACRYLNEVPNLYPAVNYHDMMDARLVYDDKYETIKTQDGKRVVSSSISSKRQLDTCTPPIVLDRDVSYSFTIIQKCLDIETTMLEYGSFIFALGQEFLNGSQTTFDANYRKKIGDFISIIRNLQRTYQQAAIITSLIPQKNIDLLKNFGDKLYKIYYTKEFEKIQGYELDEFYSSNYTALVHKIVEPLKDTTLDVFNDIGKLEANYFTKDNSRHFKRPVAEQSFITLKYHRDTECWLFDYPEIKHFNGIGNTFYINTKLKGNEIFKFFVLYTNTESPAETEMPHLTEDVIFDYEQFSHEVDKHIGCIRYWDAENRLLKLSKMIYNRYDDETVLNVLAKILQRKIEGDSIIKVYPSDINYEESAITSSNWENYDENSEQSPFALNFMFYTLSMLNCNEDKLQEYFYRHLINHDHANKYVDINITDVIDGSKFPVSYSQFTIAPITIPTTELPNETIAFYGLPLLLNNSGTNVCDPYRFVLNVYEDVELPLVGINGLNNEYSISYDDISSYGGEVFKYSDHIKFIQLLTQYICSVDDYINDLQTNYKTTYNVTSITQSAIYTINHQLSTIQEFLSNHPIENIGGLNFSEVIQTLVRNDFVSRMSSLRTYSDNISKIRKGSITMPIAMYINSGLLDQIEFIHKNIGFDDVIDGRVHALYDHLKKINTPMNQYQFSKWLDDIDLHTIKSLDDCIADNINYSNEAIVFNPIYDTLKTYIAETRPRLLELKSMITEMSKSFKFDVLDKLTMFCDNAIKNIIFDIYNIKRINFNNSIKYNKQPRYCVISITNGKHTNPPFGQQISGNVNLIFQPITDYDGSSYSIRSLANICEYAFFDGEQMIGLTMKVLDKDGNQISSQEVVIEFNRISSTAERVNTFNMLVNNETSVIDFENGHESFDVVDGVVVNEKHADMNYELYIGNKFIPLEHESELIIEPKTWLQGSIDRIFIENQYINSSIAEEFSHRKCSGMYFKPVQVMHIMQNPDMTIDSIFGKYFEGETVYMKTVDGLTIFPTKITAIDHGINKGFIEANVDGYNSKWFEITDPVKVSEYLTMEIECEVIDDNIRNFLNEYSNGNYPSFVNTSYPIEEMDEYTLPGDPIYVSNNSDVVYTRLNWLFHPDVPNRFIDEEHKTHKFIYLTSGMLHKDKTMKINMINHNFNNESLPELYPLLRDEPNDHSIWDEEVKVFTKSKETCKRNIGVIERELERAWKEYEVAETKRDKLVVLNKIDKLNRDTVKEEAHLKRLQRMLKQLESPTTWFNLKTYDAALVYINNGRADEFSPSYISNIRDMVYSENAEIYIYDWEHKHWLDHSTYNVTSEIVDVVRIGEYDNYKTNRVLYSLTIEPLEGFSYSDKLLVYMGYNRSNVFDNIEMNPTKCMVRFKPYLSLDKEVNDYDPYKMINIRKHFDGYEKYIVDSTDIHVKRIQRSGKYVNAPKFRVCDIKITDANGDHTYEDIESFFVKVPFDNIEVRRKFHTQSYSATINAPIDSMTNGEHIKLICVSNNEDSSYDGNISSVMFEGYIEQNSVKITKSTLPNFKSGKFICTVFKDDEYKSVGGLVTINVTTKQTELYDEWFKVPMEYMKYRIVPDEFKLVMKSSSDGDTTITLENHYVKNIDDIIDENNENIYNPYEYYYNEKQLIRYPLSDTRNNSTKRLVIDTNENPNVKLIKAPYIGICRYSCNRIPENGFIDLTGYIPTPLTRNRYEFWVNGKCVNDSNVIILSPTSIQLHDLMSLKNFEVVELVEDYETDTELFKEGNVYVDLLGNTYANYRLALLSNSLIRGQSIRYIFNANNHSKIHDYSNNINPNNKDVEDDIFDSLSFSVDVNDYNKLINLPSINGITLFHTSTTSLGITEVPTNKIIESFDKVWKREILTNPLFMMTHNRMSTSDCLKLHVEQIIGDKWNNINLDMTGKFAIKATGPVDKYFTLYISKTSDGAIDDVNNTVKIIPFIRCGVFVLIDKSYQGMWLHSTYGDTKPIRILNI